LSSYTNSTQHVRTFDVTDAVGVLRARRDAVLSPDPHSFQQREALLTANRPPGTHQTGHNDVNYEAFSPNRYSPHNRTVIGNLLTHRQLSASLAGQTGSVSNQETGLESDQEVGPVFSQETGWELGSMSNQETGPVTDQETGSVFNQGSNAPGEGDANGGVNPSRIPTPFPTANVFDSELEEGTRSRRNSFSMAEFDRGVSHVRVETDVSSRDHLATDAGYRSNRHGLSVNPGEVDGEEGQRSNRLGFRGLWGRAQEWQTRNTQGRDLDVRTGGVSLSFLPFDDM
jgi:hypothetical protein